MLKTLSLIEQRNSGLSLEDYVKSKFPNYIKCHPDSNDKTIIVELK